VTCASGSTNFVALNKTAPISRPRPVLRARSKNLRLTSRTSLKSGVQISVEAQTEIAGRRAFEEMFVASRPKFVAMARTILHNREDAEDAVQNSFLSGYLHLRSFEGRSALSTWFTRIVLNAALMIRRKRKRTAIQSILESNEWDETEWAENIPALEPNPEMIHSDHEILQLIDGILGKMKPALRQAFTMSYFDELSGSEACAVLGLPAETFKARLFRAKRHVFGQAKRDVAVPAHKRGLATREISKRK
jgi:RNA polymerase sigma-70 factor, ECF subfamily